MVRPSAEAVHEDGNGVLAIARQLQKLTAGRQLVSGVKLGDLLEPFRFEPEQHPARSVGAGEDDVTDALGPGSDLAGCVLGGADTATSGAHSQAPLGPGGVAHELGHALAAGHYGIRTRDITLYPIGGVASLERIPENPRQEFVVALAGPAVNVALALLLSVVLSIAKLPSGYEHVKLVGGSFLTKLMWVNVSLALFNLLPAFPMDGGRVLRAALGFKLGHGRATEIAARVGRAMALGFGLLGMFGNPMLLFIALFVWTGAQGEASLVRVRSLMRDVAVSQAMTSEPVVLSPGDRLSEVVEAVVTRGHQAFPVLRDGRVVGVVTKDGVLAALAASGPEAPVLAALDESFELADPFERLDAALARLEAKGGSALVVVRGGAILGMVTRHSVGELLTMREAVRVHPDTHRPRHLRFRIHRKG